MDLVQVKIKGTVMTNRYGTLTSGDILRTDKAYAAHLVDECGAATYVTEKQAETGNAVLTVKQLHEKLDELKVQYDAKAKKADLVKLLDETEEKANQ